MRATKILLTFISLLEIFFPARGFAQSASQITPRSFAPPIQGNSGGFTLGESPADLATPAGADALFVTLSSVDVSADSPELAQQGSVIRAKLVGQRVSGAQIFAAARELEAAYAKAGYVLVRVILPPQQLIDGAELHLAVIDGYIERIDALEAKLQYLARESAESARTASNSAPSGSLEKKLADKEEQVALLMEEGQKLSKMELTHLTTIKKLRVNIQEHNKELAEAKRKQEKAVQDAAFATDRLKRVAGSERLLNEKQKLILQLQKENESLKAAKDLKDSIITDLKSQLEVAVAQGKQTEIKLASEALELEKKRVADLEGDVATLKIENNLAADRAQAQIKELREKMDKDAERARIAELEMKTEQQMLESKLEVMRARAEEVSSGAAGDAQAKLLRQIETLQTQYAVAGENWQGIEASLIARATSLEKERDEATRREADIRRKAREVVSLVPVLDQFRY